MQLRSAPTKGEPLEAAASVLSALRPACADCDRRQPDHLEAVTLYSRDDPGSTGQRSRDGDGDPLPIQHNSIRFGGEASAPTRSSCRVYRRGAGMVPRSLMQTVRVTEPSQTEGGSPTVR